MRPVSVSFGRIAAPKGEVDAREACDRMREQAVVGISCRSSIIRPFLPITDI
jgi:hypothetical protein